jgi:hypothetical protein
MEIIKYVLSPSGFIAVCFLAGFAAWISKPTRKLSYILIPGAAFLYLVFSIGPISYALLKPLEFKHAMDEARIERESPRFLVVMAAYALDEDYYPVSSKVNANSLFRLVEAFQSVAHGSLQANHHYRPFGFAGDHEGCLACHGGA